MLQPFRRSRASACIFAIASFTAALPVYSQPREWRHGDPSPREQLALEVFNKLRADPVAAVAFFGSVEMQRRDSMVVAALRDTWAPRFADGVIGLDPAHVGQTPVENVYGLEAATGLMDSRIRQMIAHRLASDPTVAALDGQSPPLPPLTLYPLYSEQARASAPAAIASRGFDAIRQTFWADSYGSELPERVATPPIYIPTEGVPFNAPTVSGPDATGGVATIRAGVPPVGTSLAHYARGQQLVLWNLYDDRISLKEAVLTGNFQPGEIMKDSFTWSADSGGRRTYGSSRMIGVHVSEPKADAPGRGSRTLAIFRSDDGALSTSDLPWGEDTRFIVGVAIADADFNSFYSIGEGVSGLRVAGPEGWFAVTSASGGYAIPVRKGAGEVVVSVTGMNPTDGTAFSETRTIVVGDDNVKIDFALPLGVRRVPQQNLASSSGDTRIRNLSTRGVAQGGDGALVVGVVVSGARKTVLIRAMAHSLLALNVRGVLRKPRLAIFDGQGRSIRVVRTQDTYARDRFGAVVVRPELVEAARASGAFNFSLELPPYPGVEPGGRLQHPGETYYSDSYDAAAVMTLEPGSYSVTIAPDVDSYTRSGVFTGVGEISEAEVRENPRYQHSRLSWGDSGVVIAEVYDLEPEGLGTLTNLSSRGRTESDARAMIVGFTIAGGGARRLLIRGVSPGLRAFGLVDVLDDPRISLVNASGREIDGNDDWQGSSHADQMASLAATVGGFPLGNSAKDSSALVRVGAGSYSVQILPQTGARSGIVLAEVYTTDP